MKIRYENTVDDVAAFTRHNLRHQPAYRVIFALLLMLPPASFIALGVLDLVTEQDVSYLLTAVVSALGWLVLFWLLLRWLPTLVTRRLMRGGRNLGVVGWHELELADGTLIERTDVNTTTAALHAVEKMASDDARTFIYTSSISAHVIPRRSVHEGDYDEFVDALRREWEQARPR